MKLFAFAALDFLRSQEGASMVEYGLLIGLLSLVVVAAVMGVRDIVTDAFGRALVEFARSGVPAK